MTNSKKVKLKVQGHQIDSQAEEEVQDIKMYKITKIIFAQSLRDALLNENLAEVVEINLNEEIKGPNLKNKIGY